MNIPSKQQVLESVGQLVRSGSLSLSELQTVYQQNAVAGSAAPSSGASKVSNLIRALYIVGTLIVCLSICLLIGQNWEDLNTPLRILTTLGLGLAVMAGAWARMRRLQGDVNEDLLSNSLLSIGSVGWVVGAGVVAYELGANMEHPRTSALLGALLCLIFVGLYRYASRALVLIVAAIIMAVVSYYASIQWAFYHHQPQNLYDYATAAAGLLLGGGGYLLRTRVLLSRLSKPLYDIGALLVLLSFFWFTFAATFFGFHSDLAYDILYPFVLAAVVLASVQLNSRRMLSLAALFLTAYIFEISIQYFSHFLGGAIALCLGGGLMIGTAFGATKFAKRFIRP